MFDEVSNKCEKQQWFIIDIFEMDSKTMIKQQWDFVGEVENFADLLTKQSGAKRPQY